MLRYCNAQTPQKWSVLPEYTASSNQISQQYHRHKWQSDHGKPLVAHHLWHIKRIVKTMAGFKTFKSAYSTIRGIEVMRALKKGQATLHQIQPGILGEVRPVERASSEEVWPRSVRLIGSSDLPLLNNISTCFLNNTLSYINTPFKGLQQRQILCHPVGRDTLFACEQSEVRRTQFENCAKSAVSQEKVLRSLAAASQQNKKNSQPHCRKTQWSYSSMFNRNKQKPRCCIDGRFSSS